MPGEMCCSSSVGAGAGAGVGAGIDDDDDEDDTRAGCEGAEGVDDEVDAAAADFDVFAFALDRFRGLDGFVCFPCFVCVCPFACA